MFDKKQKSCVKRIHLVIDDDANEKPFIDFYYSSFVIDGEFISYQQQIYYVTFWILYWLSYLLVLMHYF